MEIILLLSLPIIPILIANVIAAGSSKSARMLFDGVVLALHAPLLLLGVVLLLLPPDLEAAFLQTGMPLDNLTGIAVVFAGLGAWGVLVSLPPLRRLLARLLPLDASSPVHTLALVLAGYLVANTLFALTQDVLVELAATAVTVSIAEVVAQQLAFVVIALLGVGLFIRRDWRSILSRLGLERPTRGQLKTAVLWIAGLVVLQWIVGAVWALLSPEQAELLGDLNESLLGDFDTVGEWLILALAAGIGEEILFRGALQPVLGLVGTSILFALVHVQYGLTPITLLVFVLGFALGIIRLRNNTTVAILVHTGYNFVLGLLSLLAVYLEQFIS